MRIQPSLKRITPRSVATASQRARRGPRPAPRPPPAPRRRSRSRTRRAARPACGRNSRRHSRAAARRRSNASSGTNSTVRHRRSRRPAAACRSVPRSIAAPGCQRRKISGLPRLGVSGSSTGWPRACSAMQQRPDVDLARHRPERRRRRRLAAAGSRAAHVRASAAPAAGSHRRARRQRPRPRARACRSSRIGRKSAEPPWPLAFHPPRACLCRWAPDTVTRITTEPAPGRMLIGPGDELPDAPGSPARPI